MSKCCKHSYCTNYTSNSSGYCAAHETPIAMNAEVNQYVYMVFYELSDESEWNYLAAFHRESDAVDYSERSVWSHLKMKVSRQPIF